MIRKPTRPVEQLTDRSQRLKIREVTVAAHDTALEEPRARAPDLHLVVVVALEGNAVEVAEAVEEMAWYATEVCRVADAIPEAVDHEPVRPETVMCEANGNACQAVDRRKRCDAERPDQLNKVRSSLYQKVDLVCVTVDWNVEASKSGAQARRKMISIEMREADGGNIDEAYPRAIETLGECARPDAGVDQ